MSKKVITTRAILSYPFLFQPQTEEDGTPGKYSAAFLFMTEDGLEALNELVLETAKGMDSEIVHLCDEHGRARYAGWYRRVVETGRSLYTGFYMIERVPQGDRPCVKVVFPMPEGNATVILEPRVDAQGDLELDSKGPRLHDVSVAIASGVTAVLGQSGAGKTSLLNLLVGFETPDAGSVRSSLVARDDRLPVFWVPQEDGLWPHVSVADHWKIVSGHDDVGLLAEFDMAGKGGSFPDELPEGERARLSVARALASGARVLVMDEPLAHVDSARGAGIGG